MSKAKHTPGPWTSQVGKARENLIVDEIGFIIASVNQFAESFGDKQDDANAHLIAAAPDLLAALKMLHDVVDEQVDSAVVVVPLGYARAAIAKAEGNQ